MEKSYLITLKDLEQPYRTRSNEQLYLRNISLGIEAGETMAFIGRQGSGKTALLRAINLLDRPMTGMVNVDNQNLAIMMSKELRIARRRMGYVGGQLKLLHAKSVFDNIALPLEIQGLNREDIKLRVTSLLETIDLSDRARAKAVQLTPLQRLKVCLARALVTNPKALLCDDITANLDARATHAIVQLLKQIQQERKLTLVLATNDAELIKTLCQRVGILHQGELVECCSVYRLFADPRTDIAKEFVRASARHDIPWHLRRRLKPAHHDHYHPLIRVAFTGCMAPETVISEAIQAYRIRVNILQAHQETIQDKVLNLMIIEMQGKIEFINKALAQLTANQLFNEVIGYVPSSA